MTTHRVTVGDEILTGMPRNHTCNALRIAHQVRTIRILSDGVQIIDDPFDMGRLMPISRVAPISHADAGVLTDDEGLSVPGLPGALYQVMRDGEPISPLMTHDDGCFRWIRDRSTQSVDWATKYEGYATVTVTMDGGTLPVTYEQYARLVDERYGDPHRAADALPAIEQFTAWGFRYWTQVLDMPGDREYACHRCGKPYGH